MIDFYCIHKEDDVNSIEPLNDSITSGKQFNINVIPFAGIYSKIDEHLKKENLFLNDQGLHKIQRRGKGVLGCFLSHYKLWKKSYELNLPIGVLEYDAIFIRDLPKNILDTFEDYLNLDYTRHTHLNLSVSGKEYIEQIHLEKTKPLTVNKLIEKNQHLKNSFKYINNNHIKGAFGYIIKPSGAKKLIDATLKYGILPADIQPNLLYCEISYVSPSIVMLNPKGIENRYGASHTNTGHLST